jgi:hypothetical protein
VIQPLYNHLPLIDEAHNLHQATAMEAKQWVNLPDFLDRLALNQRRDFLRAEIAYGYYLGNFRCHFLRFVL